MTLSIWRFSHLFLASIAAVFLIVAAMTGFILSFSPIQNEISDFHIDNPSEISISTLIKSVQGNNLEVIEIKIDENEFIQSAVITNDGEYEKFYTDAITGKKIGEIIPEHSIYKFSRNLHRSLFLKTTGRILIGIVTFILFLISISGTILIIKKQLKIKKFFSKIIYDNFYQYWHTVLTRYSLFIVIIISLSGTYLSLHRFEIFPKKENNKLIIKNENIENEIPFYEFPVFKNNSIADLESIEFPFTKEPEFHFILKLKSKELLVNQFNGDVINEYDHGTFNDLYILSYNLHTGKGSVLWSIVICIASLSILFFIFSGFQITFKRIFSRAKNTIPIEESNILILVGSENGSTMHFARQFYNELIKYKKKVHIEILNNYKTSLKAKKIIIMTSTYGNGEAPANASNFIKKFKKRPIKEAFEYSVIGFGSTFYPNFCKYAKDVNEFLDSFSSSKCTSPIYFVNNRSQNKFEEWLKKWKIDNNYTI